MIDLLNQVIAQLFNLRKLIHERADNGQVQGQCSYIQLKTLRFVADNKRPTMREISEFLGITPPSATDVINRLMALRLLSRSADKDDRRIIRLSVTADGRRHLDNGLRNVNKSMKKVLSVLNRNELVGLNSIINKLVVPREK